jgi:predicted transposase YbfD/YdcC
MDYTTLISGIELPPDGRFIDANSLYRAFEQVPDGRKKRGQRYCLALLLTLLLLARLAGATEIKAAAEWIRLRKDWLGKQLQLTRKTMPCTGTYLYALNKIDQEHLTQIIAGCLIKAEASKRCEEEPSRLRNQDGREQRQHVALDGKTLRGTLGHEPEDQPCVHLLSVYEVKTGLVLTQRVMADKENEISAAKEMALPLYMKGRVITADAMHTQKTFCQQVNQYDGKYVLYFKENHPTAHEDLAFFFEDPDADQAQWNKSKDVEKGHGRLTTREVTTSTEMKEWFEVDWAGVEQVFRIQRTVVKKGKTSHEVVYGLTNFPSHEADPASIGTFIRAHWAIENRLHWRRDVTLKEDHSQIRERGKPAVLAVLNNTVLSLMDWLGVRNVPSHMRFFDAHPHQALALLIGAL